MKTLKEILENFENGKPYLEVLREKINLSKKDHINKVESKSMENQMSFNLRIPRELMDELTGHLRKQPWHMSKNTWIIGAIIKTLKEQQEDARQYLIWKKNVPRTQIEALQANFSSNPYPPTTEKEPA